MLKKEPMKIVQCSEDTFHWKVFANKSLLFRLNLKHYQHTIFWIALVGAIRWLTGWNSLLGCQTIFCAIKCTKEPSCRALIKTIDIWKLSIEPWFRPHRQACHGKINVFDGTRKPLSLDTHTRDGLRWMQLPEGYGVAKLQIISFKCIYAPI